MSTEPNSSMSTLYEARTGSGKVTITESSVTIDAPGGRKSETVPRAAIARIDAKTVMASLFGIGGGRELTIHTNDGRKVVIRLIKPKDAAAMLALLR